MKKTLKTFGLLFINAAKSALKIVACILIALSLVATTIFVAFGWAIALVCASWLLAIFWFFLLGVVIEVVKFLENGDEKKHDQIENFLNKNLNPFK